MHNTEEGKHRIRVDVATPDGRKKRAGPHAQSLMWDAVPQVDAHEPRGARHAR